jgi:uncharacterized protein (TIGR00290 family)
MKAISLLSGGKDSYMSLVLAQSVGMEMITTITVRADIDSMMFHFPNSVLGSAVSEMLEIDNVIVSEHEFEDEIKKYSGCVLVAGAVESEYQKTRLENLAVKNGLKTYFPLWRKKQISIMRDFIDSGSQGIFVSVAAEGLDEHFLGRRIDNEALMTLIDLNRKYGISVAGEGGEYETLVTYNPFNGSCIKVLETQVIDRGIQKNLVIKRYRLVHHCQQDMIHQLDPQSSR